MLTYAPPAAASSASDRAASGLADRCVGLFLRPRATYEELTRQPRWLGLLLVATTSSAVSTAALLATAIGRQAFVDQQMQTLESFGQTATDAQYQLLQAFALAASPVLGLVQLFVVPAAVLTASGIAFAVFNGVLAGRASFRQVVAVVSGSALIFGLRAVITTPIQYMRETMADPTTLTIAAPFLDDSSFVARLLGSIDVFGVWWALSVSIGLGVLYRRRAVPILAGVLATYAGVALIVTSIRMVMSGA